MKKKTLPKRKKQTPSLKSSYSLYLIFGGLAFALLVFVISKYFIVPSLRGQDNPLARVLGTNSKPSTQEYWLEDQITSVGRFADLPYDVKKDLDAKYYQSNIKSGIRWIPSTASRKALYTIGAANLVNKVSGAIVAALDGGKQKVYEWLAEEIAKTAAAGIISTTTGSGTAADITIWIYETGGVYKKVADKTFKAITKGDQLSLEVASWILSTEMNYINSKVSQGFQKLSSLGKSGEPLEVYIVGIQGENKKNEKLFDTGLEFYYYDSTSKKYRNYFSDVYSSQVQSVQAKSKK